jgi:hypothetical protein
MVVTACLDEREGVPKRSGQARGVVANDGQAGSSPGCNRQQGGSAAGELGTGGPAAIKQLRMKGGPKPPFHLIELFTEHSKIEQSPIKGELKP